MRRNTLIVAIISLVCLLLPYFPVNAATSDNYTVKNLSDSFRQDLESLEIPLNDSMSFSETVVYSSESDKMTNTNPRRSVAILSRNDKSYTKTILFFEDKEGNLLDIAIDDVLAHSTKSSSSGSYSNSAVIISCTATYEVNTAGGYWRYRPMSVSFAYQVKSGYTASNVGDISVSYRCGGVLQEVPGFAVKNSTYTHVISVYRSTPSVGISYSASNPLASNRVIDISSGPFAEHDVMVSGYYGAIYFSGFSSNFS